MLNQVDHIGIAVRNFEESIKKYENLFKLKIECIETAEEISTKIAYLKVGEVIVELLAPMEHGKGPIGEFIEKNGEGLNHIAYRVENLENALKEMKTTYPQLKHDQPRKGGGDTLIAFLDPGETNSVLTELVERKDGIC